MPLEDLESLFEQMSPRYLLYTSVKEILRHIKLYQRLGAAPLLLEAQIVPGTDYRTVTVITSYSIHYTKLYDLISKPGRKFLRL